MRVFRDATRRDADNVQILEGMIGEVYRIMNTIVNLLNESYLYCVLYVKSQMHVCCMYDCFCFYTLFD